MAATKCGHCGNHAWEIQTVEPAGGAFKQNVLQCHSCGVPIGVLDFYNLGLLLKGQGKVLAGLNKQITQIEHDLRDVKHVLQRAR